MSARMRGRPLQEVTPEEEMENLRNEVGVLRRAVESKSAAVGILRAELQECQRERDQFRTLAEEGTLRRSSSSSASKPAYSDPCRSAMLSGSDGTLAQLLSQSKEENKTLRQDATELRCKLHDAQADIKVLREEIQRSRCGEGRRRSHVQATMSQLAHQEREQFISQMEELSAKSQALEGDVRGLVEEREELVRELDASYHKLHRLNYVLNTVLANASAPGSASPPKRVVDLDAVITENRYLQQRMKQAEEEKVLAKGNASKYKAALEKCRSQGSLKLGTSENLIVTPKQVCELLRDYREEVGGAAESDLRSLCVALVDALNQRSRALRTQRSANRVLVARVSELERRLGDECLTNPPPTQLASLGLMEGYAPPSGPLRGSLDGPAVARGPDEAPKDDSPASLTTKQGDEFEEIIPIDQLDSYMRGVQLGRRKRVRDEAPGEGRTDDGGGRRRVLDESGRESNENGLSGGAEEDEEPANDRRVKDDELANEELPIDDKLVNDRRAKDHELANEKLPSDEEPANDRRASEEEQVNGKLPSDEEPANDILPKDKELANGKLPSDEGRAKDDEQANGIQAKDDELANDRQPKDDELANGKLPKDEEPASDKLPKDEERANDKLPSDEERTNDRQANDHELANDRRASVKEPANSKLSSDEELASDRQANDYELANDIRASIKEPANSKLPSDEELANDRQANDYELANDRRACDEDPAVRDEDDESSFELSVSDYDSDNDNLDAALREWQKDCGGKRRKGKKGGSPSKDAKARGGFSLWRRGEVSPEDQLSSALRELLASGTDSN